MEGEDELTDRKEIAKNYLKVWFTIDFLAIVPMDLLFSCLAGEPRFCPSPEHASEPPSSNVMLRFPRLLKLARIVRMVRMLKLFKLLKNKRHLQHQFHSGLVVSSSVERLCFLVLGVLYA